MTNQKETLWTKDFIMVCIAGFLANISVQMLNSTLAPFAAEMWDSKTIGGLLTSFFNIGSIVMAFFCAKLMNKLGRKNSLVIAGLLYSIPTVFIIVAPTPAICMIVRIFHGLSKGIVYVVTASVVSDVTPQSRMTEGLGLYGLANTFALGAGAALGLVLSELSYNVMFAICALSAFLTSIVSLGITYEKKLGLSPEKLAAAENQGGKYRGIWTLIEKKAILSGINHAISFGAIACITIYISSYSGEVLGLSALKICIFYFAAAAAMLVIRLFCGKLCDKYGPFTFIIPGHLSTIIMLLLLIFNFVDKSYPLFLVCGALFGVSQACNMPAMNAMAVLFSPEKRNGAANSTFYFLMDFGILFASLSFGPVIDSGETPADGYRLVFIISLIIALISLAMSIILYNKKHVAKAVAEREV